MSREIERSIEGRLKKVERNMERRENEKKRKNIIIRRVEIREGKRKKAEEILKILGAKAEIKEIRKIKEMIKKDGKMMLIKLGNEELIGKDLLMMREKEKFERKKKITEDLTWRERKTRWKLQEIARSEEEGGRKVWMRQGRIRINKQW